jgi:FkbM family methyltransferase
MFYTDKRITKDDIEKYLPDKPLIIEAGAHIGRDTVKMAKRWPSSSIYAFEPITHLYEQLVTRTNIYPHVTCIPKALSHRNETRSMFVSGDRSHAASSLHEPDTITIESPSISFTPTDYTITTTRLDTWCVEQNITHIDFMWLDMQGGEYNALVSLGDMINHVHMIYTEINITQRYKNHPLFDEYCSWLESKGFTLIAYELSRKTWGNALFVRQ